MIDDLCHFLEGRTEAIVERLRTEMEKAAEEMRFERAAVLRDQIQAIDRVWFEHQKVISSEKVDSDSRMWSPWPGRDGEACGAGLLHPQRHS